MKENKFSGYIMAGMCFFFIFINMGCLNSLGVFMPSLVQATGYSTGQISLMFTFAGATAALTGMLITPKALRKFGERKCMFCTVVLTAAHALIYSFSSKLIFLYFGAIVAGVALGIGLYAACCAIVGNWFIKDRLFMLSLVSAGSGIGSAFLNMFCGASITAVGYKTTYRILAVGVFVIGTLICLLVKNKPADIGQKPLGETVSADSGEKPVLDGISFQEAKKGPSLYLIFAAAVIGSIGWTGVNMYLITLLSSNFGLPVNVATRYDALLRICIALFLFFGGKIADKAGVVKYVILVGTLLSAGLLIILITGSTIVTIPVLLAIVMIMISVGGSQGNANNQIMASSVFGRRDFTTIQAYLVSGANTGIALSAIVAAPFISPDGSTLNCFKLFLVCTLVWLALVLMGINRSPYYKEKAKERAKAKANA